MLNGYIEIEKDLFTNPLYKSLPFTYRHVFMTIICHAAFKETKFDDHNVIVNVQPGQFLTTYRKLAKLCDEDEIDARIVQRAIDKLIVIGFIKKEVAHRKTLFTILGGVNFKKCQKPVQETVQETVQEKRVHIKPEQQNRKVAVQDSGQESVQSRYKVGTQKKKDSPDSVFKGQSKTVVLDIAFSKENRDDIRIAMKRYKLSDEQVDSAFWLIDNKVDSDVATICWWVKKYDCQRIKDVFVHAKEKAKGSVGAYMQKLLRDQAYVPTDVTKENKRFAEDYKISHKWTELEIQEKYVMCKTGNSFKELPLIYQPSTFIKALIDLHTLTLSF